LKKLLLIIWVCLAALPVSAAHLVGGEMSYKCVGNNKYEITLKIYRDCNSTGAQFDPQASIGIFKSNGDLFFNLSVNLGPIIKLPTSVSNPCLMVPPNICTEMATYKVTATLPAIAGGYTITHQRCCRNQTITNIPNPGTWGNTYTIKIPSNDTGCNSSPAFNSNPPIILCMNDSLDINSSASEPDGDSLFYEFCNPLHGGSQTTPAPSPPNSPNYLNVPFKPGYSASNPMPGNPTIQIDGQTGMITGKPSSAGQYVLAICVSEYRNSVKLSTTRRDYQFNVTNCMSSVTTQIVSQSTQCSGKTVSFSHQTFNGTKYFWDFGDPNTLSDTSVQGTPTYTYNDTGTYTVKLVVNKGWPCSDSAFYTIKAHYPVTSKFKWSGDVCLDKQQLKFEPDANVSAKASYFWYFGNNANVTQSTDSLPPLITFNQPGKYYVTLQLNDFGCIDIYGDTVEIFERPNADFIIDNNVGCAPYTVEFNDNSAGSTSITYLWDFGDGTTSSDPSPTHTYNNPGVYPVSLLVYTTSGCIDTSFYTLPGSITVNPSPVAQFSVNPQVTSIYKPRVEVIMNSLLSGENSALFMGDGSEYNNQKIVTHSFSDTGTFEVMYIVLNQYNCPDTLVKTVRIQPATNIFVPNAFTPNGDGINEIFIPEITGARTYEFIIFSRWGNTVFQTNNTNEGWNGAQNNSGEILPLGIYTYVINIKDLNGEFHTRTGTITMIR